jgi:hypothetical protein
VTFSVTFRDVCVNNPECHKWHYGGELNPNHSFRCGVQGTNHSPGLRRVTPRETD